MSREDALRHEIAALGHRLSRFSAAPPVSHIAMLPSIGSLTWRLPAAAPSTSNEREGNSFVATATIHALKP